MKLRATITPHDEQRRRSRLAKSSIDNRVSKFRRPHTPIRSSRTNKTVIKTKPKTQEEQIKDIVVPQPGDPNRLQKGLNNIKNYGMPSSQNGVKNEVPLNVKITPHEKPKEPFKPEKKKDIDRQMITLGVPTEKKAGFQLSNNMIIYGVIGVIVLVLLMSIKR